MQGTATLEQPTVAFSNHAYGSMFASQPAYAVHSPAQAQVQQMPLTFLRTGETAKVVKVRGKGEVHHHLENLGFVAGAQVKAISEQAGNLIVEIKGAQIALDKTAASRVMVA